MANHATLIGHTPIDPGTNLVPGADLLPAADPSAVERSAIRRISLRLLPFLFILYICAYVDRQNLGMASLQMRVDLKFSAAVYGFGASVFFIGYAMFEVPSNLVLARVGARRWIARIMITWGIVASAMMFTRSATSFYLLRFLLGAAEAGFFPGVLFYLTAWFPAEHRARAVSRFMLALPVATMIIGVLAGPLLALDGRLGLRGWQWLFLVEGLPSVVLGVVVLFYLDDSPAEAKWLRPAERDWLVGILHAESEHTAQRHGVSLLRAMTSMRTWQLAFIWGVCMATSYAFSTWAPQLLQGNGVRQAGAVGNIIAVIAVLGGVAMLANGAHSDRRGERWLHIAIPLLILATGWLVAMRASPELMPYALTLIYTGYVAVCGPFWCLPSMFLTGEAAAGGLAFVNMLAAFGGLAGPNLFGQAQRLTGRQDAAFVVMAALCVAAALMTLQLRRRAAAG